MDKINIVGITILPKARYIFNAILIKIPKQFSTGFIKQSYGNEKKAKDRQNNKFNTEGNTIPDFKPYWKEKRKKKSSMALSLKQRYDEQRMEYN